jgi:hypothetical protein
VGIEVMNPESIVRILEDLTVCNAVWEYVKIQVKNGICEDSNEIDVHERFMRDKLRF